MSNYRYSLRRLLILMALLGVAGALYRAYTTRTTAVTIEVHPDMQPCVVYLDETPLGRPPLKLSLATVQALGIRSGPHGEWGYPTKLGFFQVDHPKSNGLAPLLHLRRESSRGGSVQKALWRDEIVYSNMLASFSNIATFELPLNGTEKTRQQSLVSIRATRAQIDLQLKLPAPMLETAVATHGGIAVVAWGTSLDGSHAHWTVTLRDPANPISLQLPTKKLTSPESAALLVSIRGADNRPIAGWESYNDGFIVSCADPRWK